MAAWNGQFFHGQLLSKGLRASDIDTVLPRAVLTPEQRRAARDEEMLRRVAAINSVMLEREAMKQGS